MNNINISLDRGITLIKNRLKNIPSSSGVYKMVNENNEILYIGKAKNLKKRIISYTKVDQLSNRLKKMISQTCHLDFIKTHTEVEALLLESNLIKKNQPKYNILLKDDKSFPYILMTSDHNFPRITKHRGSKKLKGHYFGPFASVEAVDETINSLQKIFTLRNCSDSFFSKRKRPCLQYFIKRCSAPCMNKISHHNYQLLVQQALFFLNGEDNKVQKSLEQEMDKASQNYRYEDAAILRDRIKLLTLIQQKQTVNIKKIKNVDFIAIVQKHNQICIHVVFYRGGKNLGSQSYFFKKYADEDLNVHIEAFLTQFYVEHTPPSLILLNHKIINAYNIEKAISQFHNVHCNVQFTKKGNKFNLVKYATDRSLEYLTQNLAQQASSARIFSEIRNLFNLSKTPKRIEVYDNSHIQGSFPVGVMIALNKEGFDKKSYRKFNLKEQHLSFGGDDFNMMREVIKRRFRNNKDSMMPDLLLIDGGKGQVQAVKKVLQQTHINIPVVGIAKGEERNAGNEYFVLENNQTISIVSNENLMFFLQKARDEAHRFAIKTHKHRRQKELSKSILDDIPGIGQVRKRKLLRHFGSARAVMGAGVSDMQSVPGIDQKTALRVYNFFHEY